MLEPAEVGEELPATDEGEHHVKAVGVLVTPLQAHYKGVPHFTQNVFFILDMFHLLQLDHICHGQNFKCIVFLGHFFLTQTNPCKCTRANNF